MESEPVDPNDIESLQRQVAELQAKLAAAKLAQAAGERGLRIDPHSGTLNTGTQTYIETGGGAAVEGSVEAGGHFIGRDFIQIVTKVTQAGEDPEEAKSVIALYLHALAADLAGLKLGEIDASPDQTRHTPLQLADIYVPLHTTLRIWKDMALRDWLSPKRSHYVVNALIETRPVSTLEALAEHRELTVLGNPGSGKSTLAQACC